MVGRLFRTMCEPDAWAWSEKRRVLFEGPDAWAWRPVLSAAGYEVVTCRGPSRFERCPLLVLGACATASAAHEIVCELPAEQRSDVIEALHERYPLTPVHRSAGDLLHDGAGVAAALAPRAARGER